MNLSPRYYSRTRSIHSPVRECRSFNDLSIIDDEDLSYFMNNFYPGQNHKFCTADNVNQSISYLSQELVSLGMESLFDEHSVFDVVRLVNATHEVLKIHKRNTEIKEDLKKKHSKTTSDLTYVQGVENRLRNIIDGHERSISSLQEKERQISAKHKSALTKLKLEREQTRKITTVLKQRDTQYHHEVRRKDRELDKMKNQIIQKSCCDKTHDRHQGIEILNVLQRPDGQRGKWKTKQNHCKEEEEFYRMMIIPYQNRLQTLMEENSVLRYSLISIQNILCNHSQHEKGEDLQKSYSHSDCCQLNNSSSDLNCCLCQEVCDLASDELCSRINKLVTDTVQLFKCKGEEWKVETFTDVKSDSDVNNTVSSEKPCDKCPRRDAVNINATNLIVNSDPKYLSVQEPGGHHLHDAHFPGTLMSFDLDEDFHLCKEKELFREEKINFQKEREIFTRAAIKLSREKSTFDEQKSEYEKSKFLDLEVPKLLDSNSFKSKTCVMTPNGPSTPDLFKSIDLTPKKLERGRLYPVTSSSHVAVGSPSSKGLLFRQRSCVDLSPVKNDVIDIHSIRKSASQQFIVKDKRL